MRKSPPNSLARSLLHTAAQVNTLRNDNMHFNLAFIVPGVISLCHLMNDIENVLQILLRYINVKTVNIYCWAEIPVLDAFFLLCSFIAWS